MCYKTQLSWLKKAVASKGNRLNNSIEKIWIMR